MKLLLLHGPAIETSRRKLQELKKQFNLDSVVVFDSEASAGQVVADFLTVPMFSEKRLIIWENPSEVFTLPTTNDQLPATMVLWFDREVDVKKWPGYEPLFFPEAKEVSVCPFLDFLAAKDQKAFLEMEKFKAHLLFVQVTLLEFI